MGWPRGREFALVRADRDFALVRAGWHFLPVRTGRHSVDAAESGRQDAHIYASAYATWHYTDGSSSRRLDSSRSHAAQSAQEGTPMRLIPQQPRTTCCERCGGLLWRDYDGDFCCLLCGSYVYANPVTPPAMIQQAAQSPRKRGRPRKVPIVA
jgi:hypothetical protein